MNVFVGHAEGSDITLEAGVSKRGNFDVRKTSPGMKIESIMLLFGWTWSCQDVSVLTTEC